MIKKSKKEKCYHLPLGSYHKLVGTYLLKNNYAKFCKNINTAFEKLYQTIKSIKSRFPYILYDYFSGIEKVYILITCSRSMNSTIAVL